MKGKKVTERQKDLIQPEWNDDPRLIRAWIEGKTGYPFVDANMRELMLSGWMSNRGRQVVASFLIKDMKMDWRIGAEWFESHLLDYDVGSNWGNCQSHHTPPSTSHTSHFVCTPARADSSAHRDMSVLRRELHGRCGR